MDLLWREWTPTGFKLNLVLCCVPERLKLSSSSCSSVSCMYFSKEVIILNRTLVSVKKEELELTWTSLFLPVLWTNVFSVDVCFTVNTNTPINWRKGRNEAGVFAHSSSSVFIFCSLCSESLSSDNVEEIIREQSLGCSMYMCVYLNKPEYLTGHNARLPQWLL